MLSSLRDRRGQPNARVRLLALVLALLLAGPLAAFLVTALSRIVRLAM